MKKRSQDDDNGKTFLTMRRSLVFFVSVVAVLSVTQIGFAYSNAYTRLQNEKQLLADGDMEAADTSAWTGSGGAVITKETTSPKSGKRHIRVTTATTGNPTVSQTILTIGKQYRITGFIKNTGAAYATINTGPSVNAYITVGSGWEKVDVVATAGGGTQLQLICAGATSPAYCEWDDVFVTDYVGGAKDNEKNILTDGDMEASGTASWSIGNATVTKQTSGQKGGKQSLRAAYNGVSSSGGVTRSILTIGKTYRIRGFARTGGAGSPYPAIIASGIFQWSGGTNSAWQPFDITFVCSTNGVVYLYGYGLGVGNYVEFDEVFVTEYAGRTNDIEKQVVVDGDMEKSGVAYWTGYSTAVTSKITSGQYSGKQSLRVTNPDVNIGLATQLAVVTGRRYRVTGKMRSDGTKVPCIGLGNAFCDYFGTNSTQWQNVDFVGTAIAGSFGGYVVVGSRTVVAGYVDFDDLFVTALP